MSCSVVLWCSPNQWPKTELDRTTNLNDNTRGHTQKLPFITQNDYDNAELQESKQVAMETGARTNAVRGESKFTNLTDNWNFSGVAIFFP